MAKVCQDGYEPATKIVACVGVKHDGVMAVVTAAPPSDFLPACNVETFFNRR